MGQVFLIVVVLIALAFIGLGIGIWIKGKFPDTHVGHNPEMKKLGITCAKTEDALCQGRKDSAKCEGCALLND
ncbi:MAG: hypothetical protein LBQ60_18400 [Bacteroidales bacterium]|jgi:hypothetical protein|nr:hypothetical protein [Bacteroidales bacterium]